MTDDATGVPDTAAAMIAEQWARQHARDAYDSDLDDYGRQMLAVLIAEYDRRGAALADLEAELVGVRSDLDRLREVERAARAFFDDLRSTLGVGVGRK